MMRSTAKNLAAAGLVVVSLAGAGWAVHLQASTPTEHDRAAREAEGPIPVKAAEIERDATIEDRRVLSGTLQPRASFVVASEVGGRVAEVHVALGDAIERGQVVARLDDERFGRTLAEARSELAIARSEHAASRRAVEIAARALRRVEALQERGIASNEELEAMEAQHLSAQAEEAVAQARVERAKAALRTAKLELGYTQVRAEWSEPAEGEAGARFVAARHVDPGQRVAAHAPLVTVVSLDPIDAIVHVTEEDYGRLRAGLPVELHTEAFPDQTFSGRIARIAPAFAEDTATARVEIEVDNPGHRLKPGMFVEATAILDRAEAAAVVPREALVTRNGRRGVFVLREDGRRVAFVPVEVGIEGTARVQIDGEGLRGRVVTLGHERLEDGAEVAVPPTRVGAPPEEPAS